MKKSFLSSCILYLIPLSQISQPFLLFYDSKCHFKHFYLLQFGLHLLFSFSATDTVGSFKVQETIFSTQYKMLAPLHSEEIKTIRKSTFRALQLFPKVNISILKIY